MKKKHNNSVRGHVEIDEELGVFDNSQENLKMKKYIHTNPWTAVITFVAVIAIAALICVFLWNWTHADKKEEVTVDTPTSMEDVSETLAEDVVP